jgi:hypothetical protein
MANHTGSEGVVKIGTNTLGEVRSFTITETGDTIEDSTMGDSSRTYKAGMKTFTGSVVCYWDETDTAQIALTVGASVTLNLYPEGTTTGDKYYTGSVLVTSIERSAAFDGMVETTFSYQGTGTLTLSTAP